MVIEEVVKGTVRYWKPPLVPDSQLTTGNEVEDAAETQVCAPRMSLGAVQE